jgi:hypothetical protein
MNTNPPSFWSIGQKIICINDSFPRAVLDWCNSLPIAGNVYTIRAMQVGRDPATGLGNLGFLLEEIVNPSSSLGFEAGFWHTRFVPWLDACSEVERNDAIEPLQIQRAE